MDPNHPNYYDDSQNFPNFGSYFHPQNFLNSEDQQNSDYYQNSQFSPNLTQIPTSEELPTSQNISRNLFGNVPHPNRNQKGGKNISWCVKEDVALMSAWIYVSTDSVRGKNQKKPNIWSRVHALYHEAQAENPDELNPRNIESMKGRHKRLSENAGKWVAALEEANRRKRIGMSQKDTIYEATSGKFQDLVVYNDVMSKHPRWAASYHNDATRLHPEDESRDDDEESGGSTKRSRSSTDGEYHVPSNPDTPTTEGSTISRPTGRDKSTTEDWVE